MLKCLFLNGKKKRYNIFICIYIYCLFTITLDFLIDEFHLFVVEYSDNLERPSP